MNEIFCHLLAESNKPTTNSIKEQKLWKVNNICNSPYGTTDHINTKYIIKYILHIQNKINSYLKEFNKQKIVLLNFACIEQDVSLEKLSTAINGANEKGVIFIGVTNYEKSHPKILKIIQRINENKINLGFKKKSDIANAIHIWGNLYHKGILFQTAHENGRLWINKKQATHTLVKLGQYVFENQFNTRLNKIKQKYGNPVYTSSPIAYTRASSIKFSSHPKGEMYKTRLREGFYKRDFCNSHDLGSHFRMIEIGGPAPSYFNGTHGVLCFIVDLKTGIITDFIHSVQGSYSKQGSDLVIVDHEIIENSEILLNMGTQPVQFYKIDTHGKLNLIHKINKEIFWLFCKRVMTLRNKTT